MHVAFIPDRWESGIAKLTWQEEYVYFRICKEMWMTGQGVSVDDVAPLCRGCPVVDEAVQKLLARGKFIEEDGVLHNPRAIDEHHRAAEIKENAKRAASTRWGKRGASKRDDEGDDTTQQCDADAPHMPSTSEASCSTLGAADATNERKAKKSVSKEEAPEEDATRQCDASATDMRSTSEASCDAYAPQTRTRSAPTVPITSAHASDAKASSPDLSDARTRLYHRGKEVFGPRAGGLITKLLEAFGGNVALATAAVETASTKASPSEYIGGVIRNRGSPNFRIKPVRKSAI